MNCFGIESKKALIACGILLISLISGCGYTDQQPPVESRSSNNLAFDINRCLN